MDLVEVLGDATSRYDEPKYLDRLEGPVNNGDWIVYNGILQQYDIMFILGKKIFDYKKLIKVKIK